MPQYVMWYVLDKVNQLALHLWCSFCLEVAYLATDSSLSKGRSTTYSIKPSDEDRVAKTLKIC
jgi:hypothetical protein